MQVLLLEADLLCFANIGWVKKSKFIWSNQQQLQNWKHQADFALSGLFLMMT